jgi:hypothetical protein
MYGTLLQYASGTERDGGMDAANTNKTLPATVASSAVAQSSSSSSSTTINFPLHQSPTGLSAAHSSSAEEQQGISLAFDNISYCTTESTSLLSCITSKCSAGGSRERSKQILDGVTGFVPAGSFLAILGPSGAGKRYAHATTSTTCSDRATVLANGRCCAMVVSVTDSTCGACLFVCSPLLCARGCTPVVFGGVHRYRPIVLRSSLLDVLASRNKSGVVSGTIRYNGLTALPDFAKVLHAMHCTKRLVQV